MRTHPIDFLTLFYVSVRLFRAFFNTIMSPRSSRFLHLDCLDNHVYTHIVFLVLASLSHHVLWPIPLPCYLLAGTLPSLPEFGQ